MTNTSKGHCLRGLIFDCDGVLFDSKDANTAFYNHIRQQVGLGPMTEAEECFAHMVSTDEVLVGTIPPALLEAAFSARTASRYSENFMPLMQPEPGMVDFLQTATARGLKLAMCTNRSDSVHRVIDHFGLTDFFDPVMTVTHAPPKPSPQGLSLILEQWDVSPEDVAYVGDSLVDEQAAKAADIRLWSFRNPELCAERHFTSFHEMLTCLNE